MAKRKKLERAAAWLLFASALGVVFAMLRIDSVNTGAIVSLVLLLGSTAIVVFILVTDALLERIREGRKGK